MSILKFLVPLTILAAALAGCAVEAQTTVRGTPPCRGGVWEEAHEGPHRERIEAHWRCP